MRGEVKSLLEANFLFGRLAAGKRGGTDCREHAMIRGQNRYPRLPRPGKRPAPQTFSGIYYRRAE